jgi:hypothetical protein
MERHIEAATKETVPESPSESLEIEPEIAFSISRPWG